MTRKLIGIAVFLLAVAMLATPVMAIGPTNVPEDKNPHLVIALGGTNIQLHLPSSLMNEWIHTAEAPGPFRVQVKDAARFQIKNAIGALTPFDPFQFENKWVYMTQEQFAVMLAAIGADPSYAMGYASGVYIRVVAVGWSL